VENKRIEWVDVAKGIGIILVVLGHNKAPGYIINFIYAFHMPLFFFMSGLLNNPTRYTNAFHFFRSKFVKLIIPYMVFNAVTYLYWVFIDKPPRTYENIIIPLKGMLYGVGTDGWLLHNNALWFLTCLFLIEVIFYIITRISKNYWIIFLLLLISGVIGAYIVDFNPRLPWGLDVAFTGVVFYGIGYLFKTIRDGKLMQFRPQSVLLALVPLTYILVFSFFNHGNSFIVDMNSGNYGKIPFFYLAAFSGIVLVVVVSKFLTNSATLTYLGKNSLIIFGLHILAIKIFKNQLGIGLDISLIESLICTVGEIALLIPVVFVVGKLKRFQINHLINKNKLFTNKKKYGNIEKKTLL